MHKHCTTQTRPKHASKLVTGRAQICNRMKCTRSITLGSFLSKENALNSIMLHRIRHCPLAYAPRNASIESFASAASKRLHFHRRTFRRVEKYCSANEWKRMTDAISTQRPTTYYVTVITMTTTTTTTVERMNERRGNEERKKLNEKRLSLNRLCSLNFAAHNLLYCACIYLRVVCSYTVLLLCIRHFDWSLDTTVCCVLHAFSSLVASLSIHLACSLSVCIARIHYTETYRV